MMKRLALAASLFLCLCANAQQVEDLNAMITHIGWRANVQPIAGYNTDLGFFCGAAADIFDYGFNPSIYPDFEHHFHLETEYGTKGLTYFLGEYESSYLLPGVHMNASVVYLNDPMARFYGFGGDITSYDRSLDMQNGTAFYNYSRNYFSALCLMDGTLAGRLGWNAGIAFRSFANGDFDRKGYDSSFTLFNQYRSSGVIGDDEMRGLGLEFRAGLNWDSRNNHSAPTSGVFAEAMLIGSPDLFGTGYSWLKFATSLRLFWTPGPDWMTFACRMAFQDTVSGNAPFCFQQTLYPSGRTEWYQQGLGGMTTIRGVLPGRLIGAGYAWTNLELRLRVFEEGGTAAFVYPLFDAGMITRGIRLDSISGLTGETLTELYEKVGTMHCSTGIGARFSMDAAHSVCIEFAKPLRGNDGSFGLTTSLSYLF